MLQLLPDSYHLTLQSGFHISGKSLWAKIGKSNSWLSTSRWEWFGWIKKFKSWISLFTWLCCCFQPYMKLLYHVVHMLKQNALSEIPNTSFVDEWHQEKVLFKNLQTTDMHEGLNCEFSSAITGEIFVQEKSFFRKPEKSLSWFQL